MRNKALREIATVSRGGNFQKKDYIEDGIPCIHYGQIYTQYELFVDKTISFISEDKAKKQKMAVKNDIIMAVTSENIDDVCKCVAWFGNEDVAVSGHTAIIHHSINPKYLVYFFHSTRFYKQKKKLAQGTKVIEVSPDDLLDIMIPVPPLAVQKEIVRILDNFTELKAELKARKKQYEYYRKRLCSVGGGEVCLEDVLSIKRKDYISKKQLLKSGAYPVLNSSREILGYFDRYNNEADTLVLTSHGAYAGYCHYINERFFAGALCYPMRTKDKNKASTRFLYHVLKSLEQEIRDKYVNRSGVPYINFKAFLSHSIYLPPLKEQQRIVTILDRFDKLCNDLSAGLPAEIAARQKQYEFYRDKLLNFGRE